MRIEERHAKKSDTIGSLGTILAARYSQHEIPVGSPLEFPNRWPQKQAKASKINFLSSMVSCILKTSHVAADLSCSSTIGIVGERRREAENKED